MAVNEVVELKYMIPTLKFRVKPSTSQTYSLYYRTWASSSDDSNTWTLVTDSYIANTRGINTNRIYITGLSNNTSYQFKLVNSNATNNVFIGTFKTGTNIALGDSPYYNKVIIPGQTLDWYGSYSELAYPLATDCKAFYGLAGKYSETISSIQDSWSSMLSMPLASTPAGAQGTFKKNIQTITEDTDKNIGITGFYVNNGVYVAFPHYKWDETSQAYIPTLYDDDGCISAYGVSMASYNVAFMFYTESIGTEKTLCYFNSSGIGNTACSYRVYINTSGYICTSMTDATATQSSNLTTDTVNLIQANKWYFVSLSNGTITVYSAVYDNTQTWKMAITSFSITGVTPPVSVNTKFNANSKKTPFCFGDVSTNGLVIAKTLFNPTVSDTVVKKCLLPYIYSPTLVIAYSINGSAQTYTIPNINSIAATSAKVSFHIPDNLLSVMYSSRAIIQTDTITSVIGHLQSNNTDLATQAYDGVTFPVAGTDTTTAGVINPAWDTSDAFDINFYTDTDPIANLQEHFFTKHGTWGGYNGGVNGHLIYRGMDGSLVLEQHGDNYGGSVTGVTKESTVSPYTGYGGTLSLSGSFDTRTNKNYLRVGSALVSNKYIKYGEVDVWWRLPVGTIGVCPAIWLFHYIELSESDPRYNSSPFNLRNIQGSAEDGYYRVVNNEIDIELPSHNIQGSIDSLSTLNSIYFDSNAVDTQYKIGINKQTTDQDSTTYGTFKLNNTLAPNVIASWQQTSTEVKQRYQGNYGTCKFNNWVGELNSGNGWAATEEAYTGKDDGKDTSKEEYLALLTEIASNSNGFADDQYHKWTIKWLPGKTVLYVDDVKIRENKCFIPFNIMKLTIAGWFPTMKVTSTGVIDSDGIYGTPGAIISPSDSNHIGTWAGNYANFDIAHFNIGRIKYTPYAVNDTVEGYTFVQSDFDNLKSYGESFPESGLRQFLKT